MRGNARPAEREPFAADPSRVRLSTPRGIGESCDVWPSCPPNRLGNCGPGSPGALQPAGFRSPACRSFSPAGPAHRGRAAATQVVDLHGGSRASPHSPARRAPVLVCADPRAAHRARSPVAPAVGTALAPRESPGGRARCPSAQAPVRAGAMAPRCRAAFATAHGPGPRPTYSGPPGGRAPHG